MRIAKVAFALWLMLTLAACGKASPAPFQSPLVAQPSQAVPKSAVQPDLQPSKSAILGQVFTTAGGERKPLGETPIRLGRVYWNEQKTDGAFVLEGATSPGTISKADGSFAFANIDSTDYVILVGDMLGIHEIVSDSNGKPTVFTAEAGKSLDVGKIEVKVKP